MIFISIFSYKKNKLWTDLNLIIILVSKKNSHVSALLPEGRQRLQFQCTSKFSKLFSEGSSHCEGALDVYLVISHAVETYNLIITWIANHLEGGKGAYAFQIVPDCHGHSSQTWRRQMVNWHYDRSRVVDAERRHTKPKAYIK